MRLHEHAVAAGRDGGAGEHGRENAVTSGGRALSAGALLRSPAAGLATVPGVLLVVENVLTLLPFVVVQRIAVFMPSSAGTCLLQTPETLAFLNENPDTPDLSAWQGYGVLVGWVVVLLGLALALLHRRDV